MAVCNQKAVKCVVLSSNAREPVMTNLQESALREALLKAFAYAIQKVGMATFKSTSMFGSTGRKAESGQKAA
jgi:hypothetical protein